jgi:hypothetical protein
LNFPSRDCAEDVGGIGNISEPIEKPDFDRLGKLLTNILQNAGHEARHQKVSVLI